MECNLSHTTLDTLQIMRFSYERSLDHWNNVLAAATGCQIVRLQLAFVNAEIARRIPQGPTLQEDAEREQRINARQAELIAHGMEPGRAYFVAWFGDQDKHPTVFGPAPKC